MKKNKLRVVWETCEKIIAYCALGAVLVFEIVDKVVPSLNLGGSDFAISLIASSLLVIFASVDDIKRQFNKSTVGCTSTRFNDGLLDIFGKNKNLKSLDIMAHTTRTYIHSIADNDVTIDSVRILVCKPRMSEHRQYPDKDTVASLDISRDHAVELWKDLLRIGKIKNLEIRYYEFDPTFHFAIINNQFVHYGIYKIEHEYPGYHLYTLYTLDGTESEYSQSQLQDYRNFFEHIFTQFSYEN